MSGVPSSVCRHVTARSSCYVICTAGVTRMLRPPAPPAVPIEARSSEYPILQAPEARPQGVGALSHRSRAAARIRHAPARAEARPIEAGEIVRIVRMRIPRAALIAFGVPIIDPEAAGTLDVELLLGDDGSARSLRVLR
jgi:hypothetical protein